MDNRWRGRIFRGVGVFRGLPGLGSLILGENINMCGGKWRGIWVALERLSGGGGG